MNLQELSFLEIAKQSRRGLSGDPDHLCDLFVREGKCEPDLTLFFVMVCREIQQEARQLFSRGMREVNGSHFRYCGMVGFTELLRYAQCCFAVLAQEKQEIRPRDEIGLSRFDYIGREFISFSCNRQGQAQNLFRF